LLPADRLKGPLDELFRGRETVRPRRGVVEQLIARSGSTVVTGHDPDAWPGFKQTPEFYD
jgi:hypothetical protein